MTHFLRRRKGNHGYAVIKLDMSKAYDRVEWKFFRDRMLQLGFQESWVNLVNCVSTIKYKIRVNGELSEHQSGEGPQAGGPNFSVPCAEGFSALLARAEQEGKLHGIRVCRNASSVSHLLFADDSLILCKANDEEAQNLKQILLTYECSGHMINVTKSAVMFSPNTK